MRFLDKLNVRVAQSYFGKYFRLEGSGHVSRILAETPRVVSGSRHESGCRFPS